jgi:hypothetical protein
MESNSRQLIPVSQPDRPVHGSYRAAARAVALGMAAAVLCLPALGNNRRPSPTPPSTPGNFHVTAVTTSSVTFAWEASSGASGYNIFNDTSGLSLNVGNVTSYVWDVGVESGGTYSFHIEAYAGEFGTLVSAPSPEVTVTLAGTPLPTPVKPAAPVITQTSATSNTLTVSWTEATPANEINSYTVLVNGYGSGSTPSPNTTATMTGLTPSYTYSVTVTAYSLNGTTGALTTTSAPVTVMTGPATTAPAPASVLTAPTDLTGGGDNSEAVISWNPSVSANEPQDDIQYDIYIDGVLDISDSTVGQTEDIYIFPLGAVEPIQVFVVAVDNLGNMSAPSNVLTITD